MHAEKVGRVGWTEANNTRLIQPAHPTIYYLSKITIDACIDMLPFLLPPAKLPPAKLPRTIELNRFLFYEHEKYENLDQTSRLNSCLHINNSLYQRQSEFNELSDGESGK